MALAKPDGTQRQSRLNSRRAGKDSGMLSDVIALVRTVVRSLLAGNAPGQLAAAFTLGMIIGVMPKANLIALSLCVLLFSIRCNKALGVAAAIAFSFVGQWTDPFAHKVGLAVLSTDALQATYASILKVPLGPWLGFNNTVVAGSLILGLLFGYPVYFFARMFFSGVESIFGRKPGARLGLDAELQPRIAL
jgi:uncharacterized protein (TIGR03546 family)